MTFLEKLALHDRWQLTTSTVTATADGIQILPIKAEPLLYQRKREQYRIFQRPDKVQVLVPAATLETAERRENDDTWYIYLVLNEGVSPLRGFLYEWRAMPREIQFERPPENG